MSATRCFECEAAARCPTFLSELFLRGLGGFARGTRFPFEIEGDRLAFVDSQQHSTAATYFEIASAGTNGDLANRAAAACVDDRQVGKAVGSACISRKYP